MARPRIDLAESFEYSPGSHPRTDGVPGSIEVKASKPDTLLILHADGTIDRVEENPRDLKTFAINSPILPLPAMDIGNLLEAGPERPTVARKSADDEFIETYLAVNKFARPQAERETRDAWAVFKTLTKKRLKDCTRTEGRMLADHYAAKGLKSASVKKIVGRLGAAVRLAIKDGHLTFNPFSGVAALKNDAEDRPPFTEEEMLKAFAHLGELSKSDARLFRFVAATGCRPGEPMDITAEESKNGIRYVRMGRKLRTGQKKRIVPLPDSLIEHLPEKISGQLFDPELTSGGHKAHTRIAAWLRGHGIDKTLGNLRKNAQDALIEAGCSIAIQNELLGHDLKGVSRKHYSSKGNLVSVRELKEWVDKIMPVETRTVSNKRSRLTTSRKDGRPTLRVVA